jgi:hypothetical protein
LGRIVGGRWSHLFLIENHFQKLKFLAFYSHAIYLKTLTTEASLHDTSLEFHGVIIIPFPFSLVKGWVEGIGIPGYYPAFN